MDLKNHLTGEMTTEKYDKLVLSPGAAPIRPPLKALIFPGYSRCGQWLTQPISVNGLNGILTGL